MAKPIALRGFLYFSLLFASAAAQAKTVDPKSPEGMAIQKSIMQMQQMNAGYAHYSDSKKAADLALEQSEIRKELDSLVTERSRNLLLGQPRKKAIDERIAQLKERLAKQDQALKSKQLTKQ